MISTFFSLCFFDLFGVFFFLPYLKYLFNNVKIIRLQEKWIKTLNQRMSGMGLPSTTTAKRGVSPAQTSRSSMMVSNVGGTVDIVARWNKKYIYNSYIKGMETSPSRSPSYLRAPQWRCSCHFHIHWWPKRSFHQRQNSSLSAASACAGCHLAWSFETGSVCWPRSRLSWRQMCFEPTLVRSSRSQFIRVRI